MPEGPWGLSWVWVEGSLGPPPLQSKTFSIYIFDDFLKVCYITFEINLLAMPEGPTRGLLRASGALNFN